MKPAQKIVSKIVYIEEIKVSFDEKDQNKIKFNQPIGGEEFNYTIIIDKKDYLPKHNYNLCNVNKSAKLAYYLYSEIFISNAKILEMDLDFSFTIERISKVYFYY